MYVQSRILPLDGREPDKILPVTQPYTVPLIPGEYYYIVSRKEFPFAVVFKNVPMYTASPGLAFQQHCLRIFRL